MARATTKSDLMEAGSSGYKKLWDYIDSMSDESLGIEFDFSDDVKKKEAHWNRDKNLRDILVHLYEWHQLLLNWITKNRLNEKVNFLPEPYNWKTYGAMNVLFWEKHQSTQLSDSKEMLECSHKEVMSLLDTFTNEELFAKKFFDWTGTTTLGSYCVSATSSHYEWATKKLKVHCKKLS